MIAGVRFPKEKNNNTRTKITKENSLMVSLEDIMLPLVTFIVKAPKDLPAVI